MGQQLLTDFTAWSGQGFAQAAATFFGLWAKLAEGAGSFIYILLLLTSGTPGDKKWIALIWSAVILVIMYSLAISQYGCKTFVPVADKTRTLGDTNKTWWHYPLLTQTNGQHCSTSVIGPQN